MNSAAQAMPIEISAAENASNLTWLVFAGASLLLWRFRVLPALGGRAQRSLCALLGVLLLMFPIISISDDLHPDLVAAVEGESKSRLLKAADAPAPAVHMASHLPLGAVTPATPMVEPRAVILERLQPALTPAAASIHKVCVRFRAPPILQHS